MKGSRDISVGRQTTRKLNRGVADVDAGDDGATSSQAERVLARVALEVHERSTGDVAEQGKVLGKEGRAAGAEKGRLVGLVAIMRLGSGVP